MLAEYHGAPARASEARRPERRGPEQSRYAVAPRAGVVAPAVFGEGPFGMMFSTKVVTKSRRNRSGRISTSRDVVGWVRVGDKVKTTSRTIRGRGMAKALREVRAWLREAAEEENGRGGRRRAARGARQGGAKWKAAGRSKRGS
jgi:hypothetical protein